MSGEETALEVKRVLDKYDEVVASMIDMGNRAHDVVELWLALSKAEEEIRVLRKYSDGLMARLQP